MADAPIIGGSGKTALDAEVFETRFHGPLVHETARAEANARRQGTASTKTRGLVRGGGAKPWRQKGTGRARAGSNRSPIWTGGGVVFGPTPRHYTFKVNRKERRAALRCALSIHAERESLAVFDAAKGFDTPSTKAAAKLLGERSGWVEHRVKRTVMIEPSVTQTATGAPSRAPRQPDGLRARLIELAREFARGLVAAAWHAPIAELLDLDA